MSSKVQEVYKIVRFVEVLCWTLIRVFDLVDIELQKLKSLMLRKFV